MTGPAAAPTIAPSQGLWKTHSTCPAASPAQSVKPPDGASPLAALREIGRALADAVASFERDIIQDALKTPRGNRARAANLLDTTERIVDYKIRKYGIDCGRFK